MLSQKFDQLRSRSYSWSATYCRHMLVKSSTDGQQRLKIQLFHITYRATLTWRLTKNKNANTNLSDTHSHTNIISFHFRKIQKFISNSLAFLWNGFQNEKLQSASNLLAKISSDKYVNIKLPSNCSRNKKMPRGNIWQLPKNTMIGYTTLTRI